VATYVWGYANELLQMARGGQKYFYHGDDQGSPIKVTGSTGNLVEQYSYEDFGKPSFFNGLGNPIGATAIGNPWLFHAHRHDHETNLALFGARMMSYRTGGYEQRDALDELGHARTFAAANPQYVEPRDAHSGDDWSSPPGWRVPEMYAGRLAARAARADSPSHAEGGSFDAPLPVRPVFSFTTPPGTLKVLDTGAEGIPPNVELWTSPPEVGSDGWLWTPEAPPTRAQASFTDGNASDLVSWTGEPHLPTNDRPPVTTTSNGYFVPRHSCAPACEGSCQGSYVATMTAEGRCTKGENSPLSDKAQAARKKAAQASYAGRLAAKWDADGVCDAKGGAGCTCEGDYYTWLEGTKCTTVESPRNVCVCEWETRYIGTCE
jgi:hypothetical protein